MHKYARRITKNMNQKELYEVGIQEKPAGYEIVSLSTSQTLVQNVFTTCFYWQWGATWRRSFGREKTERIPPHLSEILLTFPFSKNNAPSQLCLALVRKLKPTNDASSSQLPKKVQGFAKERLQWVQSFWDCWGWVDCSFRKVKRWHENS